MVVADCKCVAPNDNHKAIVMCVIIRHSNRYTILLSPNAMMAEFDTQAKFALSNLSITDNVIFLIVEGEKSKISNLEGFRNEEIFKS